MLKYNIIKFIITKCAAGTNNSIASRKYNAIFLRSICSDEENMKSIYWVIFTREAFCGSKMYDFEEMRNKYYVCAKECYPRTFMWICKKTIFPHNSPL
jgi:hypothetical protein